MPLSGEPEPISRTVREILTALLVLVFAAAAGGATGLGAALLALGMSEGDARGGEMLLLGFSLMGGCALGFVAGVVWTVQRARRRGP